MKFSLSLLSFCVLLALNAQINPKTKWGNVSQTEIDYKQVPFEKDANAVVLFEEGYMIMKYPLETKVYRRIKILNEKGIEEANKQLIYQHKYKLQNIKGLRGQTINIENGKPVEYKMKSEDFHYDVLNDALTAVKFTFPNVKVGSIIEYEYSFFSENLRWIEAWEFQHNIPTLYSTIKINPEGLNAGFATIAVGEIFNKKYKKTQDGGNQHQWALTDVPSYTTYTFSYNPKDLRERLILQLKKYYKWKDGYYNDSPELVEITTKWTDLLKEVDDRQNSFNNPGFAKSLLEDISKSNDELEYLKNIIQYFKTNYTWTGIFTTLPIPEMTNRRVHNEKKGNAADLNLLLYSILKAAGYNVDLIILSTRDHGKIIATYPYLGQFNSVVNRVSLKDGSVYFIDGTDLNQELGYMPLRNYNQYGLVVDSKKETFIHIDAPLSELHSNQIYAVSNGKLNMTKITKTSGYLNLDREKSENLISNALNVDFTEKQKTPSTLIENKYLGNKAIFESGEPDQPFYNIDNPLVDILKFYRFDEDNRDRAIEFEYPVYYKIQTTIKIPEGYTAQIPQDFQTQLKEINGTIAYVQNAEIKDGSLQILTELYIAKSIYSNQFKVIKEFFKKANLASSKSILLKKN